MKRTNCAALTRTAVIAVAAATVAAHPQEKTKTERPSVIQTITVNEVRPLAAVIAKLERRYSVAITYEDPPYHPSEGRDVTDRLRHPEIPLIAPPGGPFSFSYRFQPASSQEEIAAVVADLLRQYRASPYGGDFHLTQTGRAFHVIPAHRRVPPGVDETCEPILSTELQVAFTPSQSTQEAIHEFVRDLQQASGVSIRVGTIPDNLFAGTTAPAFTGTMSARSALEQLLTSTGRTLSWQVFTKPVEPREYWLGIHIIGN